MGEPHAVVQKRAMSAHCKQEKVAVGVQAVGPYLPRRNTPAKGIAPPSMPVFMVTTTSPISGRSETPASTSILVWQRQGGENENFVAHKNEDADARMSNKSCLQQLVISKYNYLGCKKCMASCLACTAAGCQEAGAVRVGLAYFQQNAAFRTQGQRLMLTTFICKFLCWSPCTSLCLVY
jgi:hypothetical protein